MKRLLQLVLFIFLFSQVHGQDLTFHLNTGYGSFQMNEMKALQSELRAFYPSLHIKELENFPGSTFYTSTMDFNINKKQSIGLTGGYFSTGARNHVQDYSGEYKMDMLVNSYLLGLGYKTRVKSFDPFALYLKLDGGVRFSTLKYNENLTVLDKTMVDKNVTFNNNTLYLEPTLTLNYLIAKNTKLNLNLGYESNFPGDLCKSDDRNVKLTNMKGKKMNLDWSGVRISLGVSFDIHFTKSYECWY